MTDPAGDAHRSTIDVYQERATDWERERSATTDDAEAYTARLGGQEPTVVDLGCGPGWHLPVLPEGTIALDGSTSMLDLVPRHAPGAPRVAADLRALPFARHTLDGAWADKSYVHLDRRLVPMALWDLHRVLRVGATAFLSLFGGDQDHGPIPDDDFPGRSFSLWPEPLLRHVLHGAGFDIVDWSVSGQGSSVRFGITVRRQRTLADVVGPGMRLLLVGLNPSVYSADAGIGFARPGNRAWPALLASGLAGIDRDPVALLMDRRVGMTDLVKRATPRADALSGDEYRAGFERLDALCGWLEPEAVCVVGLTGWRVASGDRTAAAGWQVRSLGSRPVYLMPNPSGLNAHVTVADLADHLRIAIAPHRAGGAE